MRNPLLLVGPLIAAGILCVPHLDPAPGPVLAGLLACALLAWAGRSWPAAAAASLLLGVLAGATRLSGPVERSPGVTVQGEVRSIKGSRILVHLRELDGAPAQGPLLVRTSEDTRVGDVIAAFGPIGPLRELALPGDPDPHAQTRLRGVHSELRAQRLVVLRPGRRVLQGSFPHARHPGLLRALSSGDRSLVDPADNALLKRTGTRHLLAISGLHIGLLALGAAWLARALTLPLLALRRPRLAWPTRLLPALVGVCVAAGFAWAVGSPVSAQRAAWMVGCGLIGNAMGRGVQPWNLWGGAMAAVCLVEPAAPTELSFQLSFGAVAGLLSVSPRIERLLPPDTPWPLAWVARSVSASTGASLGTLPAVAWHFQELPLLSPVANLLAVPLMGAVAVPASLLGSRGWTLPAALADGAVHWTLQWLHWLDRAPDWTLLHPAVGPLGVLLLAAAVLLVKRPQLSLALLTLTLLRARPTQPTVEFLAIGQGDAAVLQLGDGKLVLVDGGPSNTALLKLLRRRRLTRIDELIISHPHPDHYAGFAPLLESLEVGAVRVPRGPLPGESDYARLLALAIHRGVPILGPDDPLPDPRLRLHHPSAPFLERFEEEANEISLVISFHHRGHSVLFTGDIESAGEDTLRHSDPGPIDVLKVAHHGSRTSSDPALLAALRPRVAVISCGVDNQFGHPHPQTLHAHRGWPVLRTDTQGTLQIALGDTLRWRAWDGRWSDWAAVPERPWWALPSES